MIYYDGHDMAESKEVISGEVLHTLCDMSHMITHMLFTGGRLNKKDGLTRYGNSHVKDKTS